MSLPELDESKKRELERWGLLGLIILMTLSFVILYFTLNEYHTIYAGHACILDQKELENNIKENDSHTTVTHYCIDGYSYIGINQSADLTAQIIGNHHPYPRKCSCKKGEM